MAIVGGFTFAAIRLAIAAWPWLALRVSGKKVAALAGFAMVMGYLCLSGWPNPAIRAAITASCAFWAMVFDRRAVSLHTLGMSALLILAVQPEAVTEPGFQMSFAATCALVALAENWPRPAREIQAPWAIRLVQGAGTLFMASLMASLVAGLATGPFALQHFNRISTYGLATNLLVEPISTFVMLPALAIGAVLAPFGLGTAPLHVAGDAIGAMNRIAEVAATAPLSQITVASAPSWTLAASFLGILFSASGRAAGAGWVFPWPLRSTWPQGRPNPTHGFLQTPRHLPSAWEGRPYSSGLTSNCSRPRSGRDAADCLSRPTSRLPGTPPISATVGLAYRAGRMRLTWRPSGPGGRAWLNVTRIGSARLRSWFCGVTRTRAHVLQPSS